MKKEFDVLLLGYYGFGNLGDELLCEASLGLLAASGVARERVAVLSASPRESEERYGVRAFDRWSIRDVCHACAVSRLLLLGGGGLFQDSTSIRSCVYYYMVVRIAKKLGLTVLAEGQSVGPLRRSVSRLLARRAFASCSHIGVRDESSSVMLASTGLRSALSPDLVMSLAVPRAAGSGGYLLFNARPGYGAVAERAAASCEKLAAATGCGVLGVALAREDEAEMARLGAEGLINLADIITAASKEDFYSAASRASGAVGMRLHFLILSALSGLPLAGCAYDPKVAGFCMRYNINLTDSGRAELSPPLSDACAAKEAVAVFEIFAEGMSAVRGHADG